MHIKGGGVQLLLRGDVYTLQKVPAPTTLLLSAAAPVTAATCNALQGVLEAGALLHLFKEIWVCKAQPLWLAEELR